MRYSYLIGRQLLTVGILLLSGLLVAQLLVPIPRIQVLCGRGTESLCEAINSANAQRVDELLQAGASANAPRDWGWTPLMFAAAVGDPDICELLIRHGAILEPDEQWRPLAMAARGGHARAVRALLRGGARVDARDCNGLTALSDAAAWGHPNVVRALIEGGANVNSIDSDGDTACIIIAQYPGRQDVMAELLRGGADVNLANARGDTALHVAARAGDLEMISLLLQHGADAHRRNRAGEEPALGDPAPAEFAPPVSTRPEPARQPCEGENDGP